MCRLVATTKVYSKGRCKLSDTVTGGHDDVMCHRCKRRKVVAVTDIPGASLHADMKETVHMLLEGTIAEHTENWSR